MSIEKLISIRQRLSTLTQTAAEAEDDSPELSEYKKKNEKEMLAVIQSIDELIAGYKNEWLTDSNLERELQRTTGRPIQPPDQPGPHEIKCYGFKRVLE